MGMLASEQRSLQHGRYRRCHGTPAARNPKRPSLGVNHWSTE